MGPPEPSFPKSAILGIGTIRKLPSYKQPGFLVIRPHPSVGETLAQTSLLCECDGYDRIARSICGLLPSDLDRLPPVVEMFLVDYAS